MGRPMRTFQVLLDFRSLVEAVQNLVLVLNQLLQVQREAGPALDRIAALEMTRHQFEAECQGLLLKAEGKEKAARNAEARERQLKRSYERDPDPFSENGDEVAEAGRAILPVHAAGGEAEGMLPLRVGVAPDDKAAAVNAKWRQ